MKIGYKIKRLRIDRGWTQAQLAKKINVSRNAISLWESGENELDSDNLLKCARIFEIDPYELKYSSSHHKNQCSEPEIEFIGRLDKSKDTLPLYLPILSTKQIDSWLLHPTVPNKHNHTEIAAIILPLGTAENKAFCLRIIGNSMVDHTPNSLYEDDVVMILPEVKTTVGQNVLAKLQGSYKVRQHQEDDGLLLVPRNPQFPSERLGPKDTIIGPVVMKYRDYRKQASNTNAL